jgi:uncharacterized DUF497 family protein
MKRAKKIEFTEHALIKRDILSLHGFTIETETIKDIIKSPEKIETGYKNRKIAQKRISPTHVLRVVYEEIGEEIRIVTFYPGKRERYEKD